jgi:hypothetical protein
MFLKWSLTAVPVIISTMPVFLTDLLRTGLEKLEEESRTRVENYEEQLRVMSDLLADMNNRLAAQADTIQQLR